MPIDLILGIVPATLQLALALIFLVRRHYRRFPWFFTYTLYSLAATALRHAVITRPSLFYDVYWVSEIFYGILALLSMREVFKIASDIFYFGRGWTRFIPRFTVFAVIVYSLWQAIYHAPSHTPGYAAMAHLQAGAYALTFGIRYLEVGICLLCLRLTWRKHFPITLQRYDFSILIGFGIFGLLFLFVFVARLTFGLTSLEGVYRYAPGIAYLLTTIIWLRAFLGEEPPVNKLPPTEEEVRQRLDLLNRYSEGHGDPQSDQCSSVVFIPLSAIWIY